MAAMTVRRPDIRMRADRKSTRLNSSHSQISYAVFCLKKKNKQVVRQRCRLSLQPRVRTRIRVQRERACLTAAVVSSSEFYPRYGDAQRLDPKCTLLKS